MGVTGVIGLVGWLEDGSDLSSLVRFFLRNPKVGICYDVRERRVRALGQVTGSRTFLRLLKPDILQPVDITEHQHARKGIRCRSIKSRRETPIAKGESRWKKLRSIGGGRPRANTFGQDKRDALSQ